MSEWSDYTGYCIYVMVTIIYASKSRQNIEILTWGKENAEIAALRSI